MDCNIHQLLAALRCVHGVADERAIAFRGRVRHLHSLGFCVGGAPGRGRARVYTFSDVQEMALAVELQRRGLMPEAILDVVPDLVGRLRGGTTRCVLVRNSLGVTFSYEISDEGSEGLLLDLPRIIGDVVVAVMNEGGLLG